MAAYFVPEALTKVTNNERLEQLYVPFGINDEDDV
jgi:hypothetical protein